MGAVAVGCGTKPNPLYCDENTDCVVGKTCNEDTHLCDPSDASVADMAVDAFVARTVQEVRDDTTPDGTPVELTDVIVIGVDLVGVSIGNLWVQQPGGGASSGIFIFGAIPAEVTFLNFGDVVDVSGGRKQHYYLSGDTSGRSMIEISPQGGTISITKKGSTATPIATDIDLPAISFLLPSEIDEELTKLSGMLVRARLVKALSDPSPYLGTDEAISLGPVYLHNGLSDFPAGTMTGTCFTSVKGVLDYSRVFHLQPQFTSDAVIGTGCP